jgi:hypothetical protein
MAVFDLKLNFPVLLDISILGQLIRKDLLASDVLAPGILWGGQSSRGREWRC